MAETLSQRVAVAIMAKAPQAGQVKTRLSPPLSADEAARLYACFLLDKIEQVGRLKGATPYLAFVPAEAEELFRAMAPAGFRLIPQEGPDLGERLHRLSGRLLEAGHPAGILVDSDTPTLPDRLLQSAVDLLAGAKADGVLGPTEDGGYYLIGLRRPAPALFRGIPWSTAEVAGVTLARAETIGLRLTVLDPWFDVDTGESLERLRREVRATNGLAPRTRQFLLERA